MMSPVLTDMEEDSGGAYKIVKIDAAADGQLAASFRVSAVPTFVLFQRGERIGQITGARSKKEMQKWINESIRQRHNHARPVYNPQGHAEKVASSKHFFDDSLQRATNRDGRINRF
jgi:thioredoxin 1